MTLTSGEPEQCRQITRGLVVTKVPVVVEFSYFKTPGDEKIGLSLYVGRAPSYKTVISQEMLEEGGDIVMILVLNVASSSRGSGGDARQ